MEPNQVEKRQPTTVDIAPQPDLVDMAPDMPKVRLSKAHGNKIPMKRNDVFTLNGAAYRVTDIRKRGRAIIRFLGWVEVVADEPPDTDYPQDDQVADTEQPTQQMEGAINDGD